MNVEEVLKERNMRGALRGPAEETKEPMRFCKGKLDDGRPCRIIVIDEADYCRRHQVEIDALVSGAPLPVKRVERPQKEAEVAKYRCAKTNCTRAVKNKDDMCWQHKGLEDQVAAGTVEDAAGKSASLNENAENHSEGSLEMVGSDHVAVDGNITVADEAPPELSMSSIEWSALEEGEVSLVSFSQAKGSTGISALLRTIPAEPEPVGMFVPFQMAELALLVESEVTPEIIREFVILGLEGKLARLPDAAL